MPFNWVAAGFAFADGASDTVDLAAMSAFDDVRGALIRRVRFSTVFLHDFAVAGFFGVWALLTEGFGFPDQVTDGINNLLEGEGYDNHDDAKDSDEAAEIGEFRIKLMEAEVDERLKNGDLVTDVLLK